MAQIVVNDEKQEVTLPLTLAELIKINKVFQPEMVTIQVNEWEEALAKFNRISVVMQESTVCKIARKNS